MNLLLLLTRRIEFDPDKCFASQKKYREATISMRKFLKKITSKKHRRKTEDIFLANSFESHILQASFLEILGSNKRLRPGSEFTPR